MSLFAREWKMISISKAEHVPSFWNRGPGELGNGLLVYIPFKLGIWDINKVIAIIIIIIIIAQTSQVNNPEKLWWGLWNAPWTICVITIIQANLIQIRNEW